MAFLQEFRSLLEFRQNSVGEAALRPTESAALRERVLIVAPTGRDSRLATGVLGRRGVSPTVCRDLQELCEEMNRGAGCALITEEALSAEGIECLRQTVAAQPPWSDFPLIFLLSGGEPTRHVIRIQDRLAELGNFTLLERPIRISTLLATVRSALRSRARQYQMRDILEDRKAATGRLALQTRELTQRTNDLDRSNADLRQFAYAASHDLQEPVRTISSYAQLLERRFGAILDQDAREYLNFIVDGARRMQSLVAGLLAYSRVTNRDGAPPAPVSAYHLVSAAVLNLRTAIEECGAELAYDALPVIVAEPTQIIQVFQNLISNALKYRSPDRRLKVRISAVPMDGSWRFSVEDNGVGIEREYWDAIFDLFKRLEGREIPGSGIGLALCRRIVERHGGRIWVESQIGRGSVFQFTIPKQGGPEDPGRQP